MFASNFDLRRYTKERPDLNFKTTNIM